MLSKRTKKLVSRLLRDKGIHKTWIVETDNVGLCDRWRRVRCQWDDETIAQYRIKTYLNYEEACERVEEIAEASRLLLPDFDCSGQAFISHTYVGRTNMPHKFVVILYWSLVV